MLKPPHRARKRTEPTSRDLQREATKRRILESARQLFAADGYDAVGLREIAAAAGISPPIIVAGFGSKAGVLLALVRENNAGQVDAGRAAAARGRTALAKLDRTLAAWAAADLAHPGLLAAMQAITWTWGAEAERENQADLQPFMAHLAEMIAAGQDRGEIRAMPVATAVEIVWALYTQGLRAGVFDALPAADVAAAISSRVRAALSA